MRRGFLGSLAGLCLGASVALGQQLPPPRQLPAEPSTPPAPSQERMHTWSDGAVAPYLITIGERAEAIRRHAVAIAREAARRSPVPDADIDQLIARDARLDAS